MKNIWLIFAAGLLVASSFVSNCAAGDVKKISKEELKNILSDPSVVVVDVRAEGDWNDSNSKIEGAVREAPNQVEKWMDKYAKENTLVFYCA